MKKLTIFRRNGYIASILTAAMLIGAFGCKKGTFDINSTNPNSPTSVPPGYALAASLSGTANLMFAGNSDFPNNWIGYWTQSGGYTPSTTYVEYQLTSDVGSGNWDSGFNNLSNYHALLANVGTTPAYANYRAIAMIMTAFVYQRIVDYYDKAPYTGALVPNTKFNYPYTDGGTIYKAITAKIDSAVGIIKANPTAPGPGRSDIVFGQSGKTDTAAVGKEMRLWIKFANTLKLKILMRQTEQSSGGSLGSAGVQAALAGYKTTDFLGAGEDATANPGYSSASNAQLNPMYYEVVADANGAPGYNQKYFRANALAVNFYQSHNDPRDSYFYYPNGSGVIKGRVYGSNNGTESNTVISAISAFGKDANGAYNGPAVGSPIITAAESLFLQAEAAQRGYLADKTATVLFKSAVEESFRFVGFPDNTAADAYVAQNDPLTNLAVSTNALKTIITQKWAALNGIDALESYSDYRRLGIPAVGVSIYLGNQAVHIPFRLPYPTSELNYNKANVPDGGTGTESLTSQIFWMPSNASTFR